MLAKSGCSTQSLHEWVRRTETDSYERSRASTDLLAKLEAQNHETGELRQANGITLKASSSSAQAELARQFKK